MFDERFMGRFTTTLMVIIELLDDGRNRRMKNKVKGIFVPKRI